MPKGMIITKLQVPEDCYCCDQANEDGYCYHVGKYVDHFVKIGEKYPTCPIVPMQKTCDADKVVELLSTKAKNCRNNAKYFGKKAEWMADAYEDAIEILKAGAE